MDVRWQTYEQVAAFLLDQMADHFGVGRFEGKQVIPGRSGAQWEIDAKGCSDDGAKLLVVECKRHTTARISQAVTGALAWTISDTGADGGILVSPLGLQAGARKVAQREGIIEVVLDENSTNTDHFLHFLDQIVVGVGQAVSLGDFYDVEIKCP